MIRVLAATFAIILASGPAHAQCEDHPLQHGIQVGLGIQSFLPGNQADFTLLAPGYLLTGGYSWGNRGIYTSLQYASSTAFSLYSVEVSFRQVLETPFLDLFGQAGGFAMSYGVDNLIRHNQAGGLAAIGILILFSPEVEFTMQLKGYLQQESILAAGGSFLFHL